MIEPGSAFGQTENTDKCPGSPGSLRVQYAVAKAVHGPTGSPLGMAVGIYVILAAVMSRILVSHVLRITVRPGVISAAPADAIGGVCPRGPSGAAHENLVRAVSQHGDRRGASNLCQHSPGQARVPAISGIDRERPPGLSLAIAPCPCAAPPTACDTKVYLIVVDIGIDQFSPQIMRDSVVI